MANSCEIICFCADGRTMRFLSKREAAKGLHIGSDTLSALLKSGKPFEFDGTTCAVDELFGPENYYGDEK